MRKELYIYIYQLFTTLFILFIILFGVPPPTLLYIGYTVQVVNYCRIALQYFCNNFFILTTQSNMSILYQSYYHSFNSQNTVQKKPYKITSSSICKDEMYGMSLVQYTEKLPLIKEIFFWGGDCLYTFIFSDFEPWKIVIALYKVVHVKSDCYSSWAFICSKVELLTRTWAPKRMHRSYAQGFLNSLL